MNGTHRNCQIFMMYFKLATRILLFAIPLDIGGRASSSSILASTSCQSYPALLQTLQSAWPLHNLAGSLACRSEVHEDELTDAHFGEAVPIFVPLAASRSAHSGKCTLSRPGISGILDSAI
jgi:hypothetical protein